MTPEELIGRVAARHLASVQEDGGAPMRCIILGMDGRLVRAIADAVGADATLKERFDIEIPSGESAAHKRNKPIKKSILFAVDNNEMQRIGKTLETLPRIETDRLRERHDDWIACAGMSLSDEQRETVAAAFQVVAAPDVSRTVGMLADYALSVADLVGKGRRVIDALDEALPALRLPRNSGRFDQIPKRSLRDPGRWEKCLRELERNVRPCLVLENPNGERINEQVRENFDELRADRSEDALSAEEQAVIERFLSADLSRGSWSGEQEELVRLDWTRIHPIFDGVRKEGLTLLEQTRRFFADNFPERLDPEDEEFLSARTGKLPAKAPKEAFDFFERHKETMATHDPRLYAKWERYLFRGQQVHADFMEGVVCALERLQVHADALDDADGRPVLRVSIPRVGDGRKMFWERKNTGLMAYFAQRHHGIQGLFDGRVEFDLADIEVFFLQQEDVLEPNTSTSRAARQLKFEVELRAGTRREKAIFYWEIPPASIPVGLPRDLETVANFGGERALFATGKVATQTANSKGDVQHVDLGDRNTVLDAMGGSDGILVAGEADIHDGFMAALDNLKERGILPAAVAGELRALMAAFASEYTEAVRDWRHPSGQGLASPHLISQAEAYRELLAALAEKAPSDLARKTLVEPLLRVGVVGVEGGPAAAIVAPWQPLRMAELAAKARHFRVIVDDILRTSFVGHQYFDWRQRELTMTYYPEVCLGIGQREEPELLAAEQSLGGYSLAESPLVAPQGLEDGFSNADSRGAAECFADVTKLYLDLLPHEKFNFSAVLYNAQAKGLPRAIADRLAGQIEEEDDLQCDLLLVHTDPGVMRQIYEQQNAAILDGAGLMLSSEAALNFLARLRVGFVDTGFMAKNPADLVFLQDVIARNARVKWKPAPSARLSGLDGHIPLHRLRRRPVGGGDTATSVYLASPAQPAAGQAYINALHQVLDRDYDGSADMLPAREIDFGDKRVGGQFEQVHKLGHWVVNYDELVDRRLLMRQDIQIVRHVRKRDTNRNVIVSTTREPKVLRFLLEQRLRDLDGRLGKEDRERIVRLLIKRATGLSGQVVMRAARHSRYALELIGMVLGMERTRRALDSPHIGWYFLDDCAAWFGQKEEQIADILALAPCVEGGQPVLKAVVAETKYVGSASHIEQKRKSMRQLEETVERLVRALKPGGNPLNRQDWLHLVANLMLENMEPFGEHKANGWDLQEWTERVREGAVPIRLAGLSHVFVHDEEQRVANPGEAFPNPKLGCCAQVTLDRELTRRAVRELDGQGGAGEVPPEAVLAWGDALDTGAEPEPGPEDGAALPAAAPGPADRAGKAPGKPEGPAAPPVADEAVPGWLTPDFSGWMNEPAADRSDEAGKRDWLDKIQARLRKALHGHGLETEIIDTGLTPNAARVSFRGSSHMTVSKVERHRPELMTTSGIDVIDVRAVPKAVVVMVRREDREVLRLRDVWRRRPLPDADSHTNASVLVGVREDNGDPLFLNVDAPFGGLSAHGPHAIVAGETGSGKGVLVRTMLLDICATNSPAAARIRMIDPKAGLDFPWLRGMPHLEGDLVTDQRESVATLDELVEEMERRNRVFAEAGAANLSDHNRKAAPGGRLPRIWVFHEEFADWMLIDDYRKSVETSVSRLGVKARAAGIHLVMVTQRPDNRVFPMQLRANLANRLCLKVADRRNSKLILDEEGAERLLGNGHLAARLSGESEVMRAQVPYSSDEEGQLLQELITKMWEGR